MNLPNITGVSWNNDVQSNENYYPVCGNVTAQDLVNEMSEDLVSSGSQKPPGNA